MKKSNKYMRKIKGVELDVYDVIQAWDVRNPALQHLIKKALQAGNRGHKTLDQDLDDIIASAHRAKELELENNKRQLEFKMDLLGNFIEATPDHSLPYVTHDPCDQPDPVFKKA